MRPQYEEIARRGITFEADTTEKTEKLRFEGKTLLAFTQGESLKGSFSCLERDRIVFLPGNRYVILTVHCSNVDGQLLIDTRTGGYLRLPPETEVLRTFHTDEHSSLGRTVRESHSSQYRRRSRVEVGQEP